MASWWQNSLSGVIESSNSIPTEVYNLTVENALNVVGSTTLSTTSTGALTSTSASTNTENISSILTVGNSSTQGNIKLYGNTNSNIATIVSSQGSVGSATITLPDVTSGTDNFTLVATSQTLTNKILDSGCTWTGGLITANGGLKADSINSISGGGITFSDGIVSPGLTVGSALAPTSNRITSILALGQTTQGGQLHLVSGSGSNTNRVKIQSDPSQTNDSLLSVPLLAGNDTFTTIAASQTLTNKTISGASNTLSNIGNGSLTNSSLTVNGTAISLGGSGTVTAAAGTLTGVTLNSTVTGSSLTSVGTIGTGTWNGSVINPTYGGTGVNNGSFTCTLGSNSYLNQAFGSYTPTIGDGTNNFTNTGTTATYYIQQISASRYLIMVNIRVQWVSKGSASGNIKISLPSAPNTILDFFNCSIGYFSGITYTNQLLVFGDASAQNVQLFSASNAGLTPTQLTATAFSASGQLRLSVFYAQ